MSRNAARMAVPQYAVGPKQQALDFADFVMIGEKLRHVPLKRKVDAHADTIELLGKEDGPSPSKRRRTALGSDLEATREQYLGGRMWCWHRKIQPSKSALMNFEACE